MSRCTSSVYEIWKCSSNLCDKKKETNILRTIILSYLGVVWTVWCWTNSNVFVFSELVNGNQMKWHACVVAISSAQHGNQPWILPMFDHWLELFSMPTKTYRSANQCHLLSTIIKKFLTFTVVFGFDWMYPPRKCSGFPLWEELKSDTTPLENGLESQRRFHFSESSFVGCRVPQVIVVTNDYRDFCKPWLIYVLLHRLYCLWILFPNTLLHKLEPNFSKENDVSTGVDSKTQLTQRELSKKKWMWLLNVQVAIAHEYRYRHPYYCCCTLFEIKSDLLTFKLNSEKHRNQSEFWRYGPKLIVWIIQHVAYTTVCTILETTQIFVDHSTPLVQHKIERNVHAKYMLNYYRLDALFSPTNWDCGILCRKLRTWFYLYKWRVKRCN